MEQKDTLVPLNFEDIHQILKKTGQLQEENAQMIRELSKQIGGLGEKFGGFTEGLALPSMTKILKERFHATVVSPRTRTWKDDEEMEVDVLAYSNSGTDEVYVVEVKSLTTLQGEVVGESTGLPNQEFSLQRRITRALAQRIPEEHHRGGGQPRVGILQHLER